MSGKKPWSTTHNTTFFLRIALKQRRNTTKQKPLRTAACLVDLES